MACSRAAHACASQKPRCAMSKVDRLSTEELHARRHGVGVGPVDKQLTDRLAMDGRQLEEADLGLHGRVAQLVRPAATRLVADVDVVAQRRGTRRPAARDRSSSSAAHRHARRTGVSCAHGQRPPGHRRSLACRSRIVAAMRSTGRPVATSGTKFRSRPSVAMISRSSVRNSTADSRRVAAGSRPSPRTARHWRPSSRGHSRRAGPGGPRRCPRRPIAPCPPRTGPAPG